MNRYFYCYSYPLKEFLISNGFKFITASVNNNTQKKYWVFEGTTELNNMLDKWKCRRH